MDRFGICDAFHVSTLPKLQQAAGPSLPVSPERGISHRQGQQQKNLPETMQSILLVHKFDARRECTYPLRVGNE